MNRHEFIKICGGTCLGLIGIGSVLQSCGTTYLVEGTLNNNRLQIKKSDFIKVEKDQTKYRKYILVKTPSLDYPVVVYRNNESTYTALLMRCTHQGNELNVSGDILTCPAHGSEFAKNGEVIQGPAEQNLTSYPVTIDQDKIYIQLS